MKQVLYFVTALFYAALPVAAQEDQAGTLVHYIDVRIIVLDSEGSALGLASWAEEIGGYFTRVSTDGVVLRIPTGDLHRLRLQITDVADAVLQFDPRASDVREELAMVKNGIASREESLDLVVSYLEATDVTGTLDLEREISELIGQIEFLKGRQRRLLNDTAYANVVVSLGSRQQTIPEQMPSSFPWINTMGLYRFIAEAMPYGY